ncbi:hypothetical protein ACFPA1_23190 [Neobacillus sp. GCM10023253]|uniref:hypothetical protein n=1 Tax=Neobacillus sp. GCM10023253 TaxID=3252644 RepID=UPI00360E999B
MGATAWQIISIVGYSLAAVLFIVAVVLFFKMNILAIIGDLSGRTAARQIEEIRERNKMTGSKRHQPDAFNLDRGSLTEPVGVRRLWTGRTGNTGRTSKTGNTVMNGNTSGGTARPGDTVSPGFTGMARGNTVSTGTEFNTINTGFTGKVDPRVFESGSSEATEVLANEGTEVLFQADEQLSEGTAVLLNETEVLLESSTEVLYESTEAFEPSVVLLDSGTEVLESGTEVLIETNETTVLNSAVELEDEENAPIAKVEFRIIRDIKITHTDEVI